jgi:hypothetical protein
MTITNGSVLDRLPWEEEESPRHFMMYRDTGRQRSLKEVRSWASHATGILNNNTAEELHRDTLKMIIEEFINVPLQARFLGGEVVRLTMEAQAKLLHFIVDLKKYIGREISKNEYEYSRQSFVMTLSVVVESTF